MINDYFFDVRLSEKYDKIAEEKFGSKFHFYSLQYKEEFEEYDKNLKIFKYLFSLGDEARIYLWNNIAISSLFDDIYENIERNDLTKEEFAFFENINNTFKELKTKYNEIYNGVININGAFETERLVLKPCDESSNNIMREYCKKNLNQFKDLYKIDNFNENKLPVGVGCSSKLKFSIFLKDSNELIGTIDLDDCICEVKYVLKVFIFDKFRGKGYATEASKAIVNKAMKKELFFLDDTIRHYVYEKVPLDIMCIEAVADENNVAANKVLEKCGFKLTGKNYYAHHYKNAYFNDNIYCYFI